MLNEVIYKRIVTALPAKLKFQLNKVISSKLSRSAVSLYTGDINSQFLHNVFKYSLHFILNEAEPKLLQHLVFLLMDLNTLRPSTKETVNAKDVKLDEPAKQKPKSEKKLVKSKERKRGDQSRPIPMEIPSSDTVTREESTNQEATSIDEQEFAITEEDILRKIFGQVTEITPSVNSSTKKRVNKKKTIPSTSEGQEAMKRKRDVISTSSYGTQPAADLKKIKPPVATTTQKTHLTVEQAINQREYFGREWSSLPPSHIGTRCNAHEIRKCIKCIKVLLLAPVTTCESQNCNRVEHSDGIFPHKQPSHTKIHDAHVSKYPGFIETCLSYARTGEPCKGLFTGRFTKKVPPTNQLVKILEKEAASMLK